MHIQEGYTYSGMFTHIGAYFNRFIHIQDPGTPGSNNVKQHLLFKASYSFKSLFKSVWNIYLFLFQR